MTTKSFSKVAAAIQNIAVSVGLIMGVWWTAKTFLFQTPALGEQGWEAADGSQPH